MSKRSWDSRRESSLVFLAPWREMTWPFPEHSSTTTDFPVFPDPAPLWMGMDHFSGFLMTSCLSVS
jgi:hypothetical protein